MNQFRYFCLSVCLTLMIVAADSAEEPSPVEQYQQARLEKVAYERFLFAIEMLESSVDAATVYEAALDAVRYSTNLNEYSKTLAALDLALGRIPVDGEAWREAMLARAKILARLNRVQEAEALFLHAIQNNWNHALLRCSESLLDNGEMVEACRLEYLRIAGLDLYKNYRDEEESLEIFLTLLRMTKEHDSSIALVAEVADSLETIADKPVYHQIAQALCLAEDGDIPLAILKLEEINAQISAQEPPAEESSEQPTPEQLPHPEYKNLPLYKASILFKAGLDYPAAEAAFLEYMRRNEGHNKKIITSALRLARDMVIHKEDQPKMDEFAGFVMDTEWFQNETVQSELSDEDKAGIYDLKQNGLAWGGDFDGAARISKYVAETYPDTLPGVNCLRNYALYVGYHDGNEAESMRLLKKVLTKVSYDETIASIQVVFAESAIKRKNYDEALEYLQIALDCIPPSVKGWKANYRKEIEALIDRVIHLKAGS